jgi:two-component system, chemotaxis family, sensor kinase CheA
MADSDDLVREFLVESYENLDLLDHALVALEKDPHDREKLASIFRTIHTIKGTCGFLGFTKLESISHVGENLLSRLRDAELVLDAAMTTGLLAMVDAIRNILASIELNGAEDDVDYTPLIEDLTALNEGGDDHALTSSGQTYDVPQTPAAVAAAAANADTDAAPAGQVDTLSARVQAELEALERRRGDDRRTGDERRQAVADTSLRVDVGLLDKLMNLVGELVLARNQILQFSAVQLDSTFVGATQRLNLVTSELQEGVMKTRMQPIGNIWSKFPRVVRDLATACQKDVRIEMTGKETELDKTIIEAIKDPLTHVIRNSVDHGIEPRAVRASRGKASQGVVQLRAYHEGGQINIEITDDGGGIDPERVRRKAIERGLIAPENAARMPDHDVIRLIFLPGFSTAETITNVSGRGVGMDVVKTNIERIGGTVDIESKHGHGSTVRIKIPLTLAIIPALMVSTGGERFAIPQVNLLELVRLEGPEIQQGIERIQGATFHRLRGQLLPLAYLDQELGLQSTRDEDVVNIVVLKADDRQFGLVVDAVNDTEEIVVKPLGKQFKSINVFAGATIMGDGRVALILDVQGVAQRAGVVSRVARAAIGNADDGAHAHQAANDARTLLLFRVGEQDRMAIPLDLVARLEEFPASHIEHSGELEVVQYRDEILPLVSLAAFFDAPTPGADQSRQVIVYTENGRSVGLIVRQILDIVSESFTVSRAATRPGVIGSAVVQQRVTDLIDVQAVIGSVLPSLAARSAAA